jgi:nuclear pore complex protein Nup205
VEWCQDLGDARLRDDSLELREGFKNEDLTMRVLAAVQSDAFSFLVRAVTELGPKRSTGAQFFAQSAGAYSDAADAKAGVTDEFKPLLLPMFELLLRALLTHAPAELRKIKHKQEDQFRPRSDRHAGARSAPQRSLPTRRLCRSATTFAVLFQLIGILYGSLPSDSAIQFWGDMPSTEMPAYYELVEAEMNRIPSFLRWAIESGSPT